MKKSEQKKYLSQVKKIQKLFDDEDLKKYCHFILEALESFEVETEDLEKGNFPFPLKDGIAAFSDGACRGNPGPGSWGYVIQDKTGVLFEDSACFELTTNNKMELSGAIASLEYLLSCDKEDEHIVLFTDSTYVVKGITEWVKSWKARGWKKADKKPPENVELWKKLDELKDSFSNLSFKWVKGHSGHPQNERCDELANIILDENGY